MGIQLDRLTEIQITDGTDTLLINGDGSINAVVSGTDIDIRDLVNTQDSIAVGDESTIVDMAIMDSAFGVTSAGFPIMGIRQDAAGSPVSADGDAHPLVFNDDGELKVAADLQSSVADDAADSGNPIKVGGRGVTTASALSALSASNDRFDLLGDLYRRLFINRSYNVGWQTSTATAGLTAVELAGTPLAGRQTVIIQNQGTASIFVGEDNTVTTSSGVEISKKSSMEFYLGEALNIYAISASAGQDVRVVEAA